jgi:predicted component of type VI protein secretion system
MEMLVLESLPLEPKARTPAQSKTFEKTEITIGRSPNADFFLDGDMISRLAIRVVVSADQIVLVDQSESGSTINGKHGWGTRPIREEDDIRIGPYRLVVRRTE